MKSTITHFAVCCLLFCAAPTILAQETVTLAKKDGKSAEFILLSLNGNLLDVKMPSGHRHQLKLNELDSASQSEVRSWVAEGGDLSTELEISFTSGKRSGISKNENYDDKRYTFSPEVTLKNKSNTQSTSNLKVFLAVLGRPVENSSNISVKWVEIINSKPIAPSKEKTNVYRTFNWEYDNRGYAKFGSRYLGYLIVVKDKNGVIASKALPTKVGERLTSKFAQMRMEDVYDKDGQKLVAGNKGYYVDGKQVGIKKVNPKGRKGKGKKGNKGKGKGKGKGNGNNTNNNNNNGGS